MFTDPIALKERDAFMSKGGGVHFDKTGFKGVSLYISVILQIFAKILSCVYSSKKY